MYWSMCECYHSTKQCCPVHEKIEKKTMKKRKFTPTKTWNLTSFTMNTKASQTTPWDVILFPPWGAAEESFTGYALYTAFKSPNAFVWNWLFLQEKNENIATQYSLLGFKTLLKWQCVGLWFFWDFWYVPNMLPEVPNDIPSVLL